MTPERERELRAMTYERRAFAEYQVLALRDINEARAQRDELLGEHMSVPTNVRRAELEVLSAVEAWRTARDNSVQVEEAELRLCRADNALIQARSKTRG